MPALAQQPAAAEPAAAEPAAAEPAAPEPTESIPEADKSRPVAVAGLDDPLRRTAVVDVVRASSGSVVNIYADEVVRTKVHSNDFWRDLSEPRYRQQLQTTALGSGVIIGQHIVVTNHHVVSKAARIRIALADRREYEAEVVGTDPQLDIAVLQVKSDDVLQAVELGKSADLMVGETVVAIGNPFGHGHTVTTGVLSALHRTLAMPGKTYHDFLQTDASINPGNSGGALLDIHGRLIGINTAVDSRAQNIGFAIPVDRVRTIAFAIIAQGEVHQGWLGLEVQPVSKAQAKILGLQRREGMRVASIDADGPAANGGLKVGDVITHVEGYLIATHAHYASKMRDFVPGSKVKMQVRRGHDDVNVSVVAGKIPAHFAFRVLEHQFGVTVAVEGTSVLVKKVRTGSLAAQAHLQVGDQLSQIAQIPVTSASLLSRAVLRARRRQQFQIQIVRKGSVRNISFSS